MRNFINSLKARRDSAKSQGGFSLIDVVVTVAIIVALSVGGFIAYNGIVTNANNAALSGAADQLRTGVTVKVNDPASTGTVDAIAAAVVADYETSQGATPTITAEIDDATNTVTVTSTKSADVKTFQY